MQNFVELLKDHALILAGTRSLTAVTRADIPNPAAAFDALRRLSRLLDMHLRAEADFITANDDLGHHDFAALADQHGNSFDDLVREWTTYLLEWSEENIRSDWPTFVEVTHWIVGRLDAQVEAENESLYPAALRYGLIRLLPEKASAAAR